MASQRSLRSRLAYCLALFLFLCPTSFGTWSIVAVNHKTGEVAIATATCLVSTDLASIVPVLQVGKGAVATQSQALGNGDKKKIKDGLKAELDSHKILVKLLDLGNTQDRQYGIVTMSGPPISWDGDGVYSASPNRTGVVGDISYAIQGNLLAGNKVVGQAEQTFVDTDGDLAARIMAAMQKAREFGGDGRCSCDQYTPGGQCGAPGGTVCGSPPEGFDVSTGKSAHTAFMIVSRLGDIDSGCSVANGCANGDYYLNIEFNGAVEDPDPVEVLQMLYDNWRAALAGRPDGVLSTLEPAAAAIPADGRTVLSVELSLIDVEGIPLATGGAIVDAVPSSERPPAADYLGAQDHGDGTYSLMFRATRKTGPADFRVTVDDGLGRLVTLSTEVEIAVGG